MWCVLHWYKSEEPHYKHNWLCPNTTLPQDLFPEQLGSLVWLCGRTPHCHAEGLAWAVIFIHCFRWDISPTDNATDTGTTFSVAHAPSWCGITKEWGDTNCVPHATGGPWCMHNRSVPTCEFRLHVFLLVCTMSRWPQGCRYRRS